MQERPSEERPIRRAARQIERAAGDLNSVLLMLAIGLAVLDLTCFSAFKLREALRRPVTAPAMSVTTGGWNGSLAGLPPATAVRSLP